MRWVVEDGSRPGGVESVVRRLDEGLTDRGVDSAVLSWLPGPRADLRGSGPRHWFRSKLEAARARESAARGTAELLRQQITAQPDLVVILDPGSLPVARHLVGTPRWGVHVHWNPDLILRPWRHLEGDRVPPPLGLVVSWRMRAVGRSNRRILRAAPFLVTLTDSHTATFREVHPAVHQIVNPVDGLTAEPRDAERPRAAVTVGYVGRLSHEKGPDVLIEALAMGSPSLRQTPVLVAGAGPAEAEARQRARDLGLGNVEFLGWVDDPGGVLRRLDVLVLPSRAEAVPLVIVEALAAGCRVVAADAGSGVRDLLLDGRLGAIVPAADPASLSRAIDAAIDDVRAGRKPDQNLVDALVEQHRPSRVIDAWVECLDEHTGS